MPISAVVKPMHPRALLRWSLSLISALASTGLFAQDSGFYLGLEVGLSQVDGVDTSVSGINHPTRCDRLLYADPDSAPMDAECTDNSPKTIFSNSFDLGTGLAAGIQIGYRFGNWRLEGEYFSADMDDERRPLQLGSAGNAALGTKDSEWEASNPPSEDLSDMMGRHLFVNLYYDFRSSSPWTPYIGAGAGLAKIEARYQSRFWRRSDLGELGPEEWRQTAAGTLSALDTSIGSTEFGIQLLGGLDYAVSDRLQLGLKAKWTRIEGFTKDDALWGTVRSHAPVIADGRTPFVTDVDVDVLESWSVMLALKYSL